MGEGSDKSEVHTYMPDGYVKNEPKKLPDSGFEKNRTKVAVVAGVLGIGAVGYLASGWLGESDATENSNDVLVPNTNVSRQIDHNIEDERVVPVKDPFSDVYVGISNQSRVDAKVQIEKIKEGSFFKNAPHNGTVEAVLGYDQYIKEASAKFNIPQNLMRGIVLIESGGHPDLTSPTGARGPAQLMPEAAERFYLRVNEWVDTDENGVPDTLVDDRIDPEKCFMAMAEYLSVMREEFGENLGIAIWAYHAGEGNVYSALREYFKANQEIDFGDATDLENPNHQKITNDYSEAIKKYNLNIHDLLNDPSVIYDIMILELGDETELYSAKAVAAAEIISEQ